eukprot:5629497-Lingulodinium_polyedra.AAC.1
MRWSEPKGGPHEDGHPCGGVLGGGAERRRPERLPADPQGLLAGRWDVLGGHLGLLRAQDRGRGLLQPVKE